MRRWWAIRALPNVMFVHFADIKVEAANWPRISEYCSFEWMKANATKSVPLGGAFWDAGAQVFINEDVNGRWHDVLKADDVAAFEARSAKERVPECARWLAAGALTRP